MSARDKRLRPSAAVAACALQDHVARGLRLSLPSLGSSSPRPHARSTPTSGAAVRAPLPPLARQRRSTSATASATAAEAERVLVAPARLTLAQQLALVRAPATAALTEPEWNAIKAQSRARGDANEPCAICQDAFALAPQVLLSCSHSFHRACLAGVERCIRRQCCPLCRCDRYEVRLIHDGAAAWRRRAATCLQAAWRGWSTRRLWRAALASRYAANPLLSRRYSLLAVSTFTGRLVSAADSRRARVDAFLAELDEERSGATMRLSALLEAHASASVDWPVAWRAAASRDDLNCPICLQTLASRPAVLLSCTHVYHVACFQTLERFGLEQQQRLCPVCRSHYAKCPHPFDAALPLTAQVPMEQS